MGEVPDGGWGWVVVLASFMGHVLTVSVLISMGVLYVSWLEEFGQDKSLTSLVIAVGMAINFGIAPVPAALAKRFGYRIVAITGACLASIGTFLASFATSVYMLIIAIGVVGGIGCGCCYLPAIAMVALYFDKKRSTALGIATAGVGIGTLIFAPFMNWLEDVYGWRGALLIVSGIVLHLGVAGSLYRPIHDVVSPVKEIVISEDLALLEGTDICEANGKELKSNLDNGNSDISGVEIIIQKAPMDLRHPESSSDTVAERLTGCEDTSVDSRSREETKSIKQKTELLPETNGNMFNGYLSQKPDESFIYVKKSPPHLHLDRETFSKGRLGGSLQLLNSKEKGENSKSLIFSSTRELLSFIHSDDQHNKLKTIGSKPHIWNMSERDILMSGSMHSLKMVAEDYNSACIITHNDSVRKPCTHNNSSVLDQNASTAQSSEQTSGRLCQYVFSFLKFFSLLKDKSFFALTISSILTNLSFLMPVMYMVDRAVENGIDKSTAAILLSINGIGNVLGRIITGIVADRLWTDSLVLLILALSLCGLSTCLSPVCGGSAILHAVFSLTFGFFIGAYVVLVPICTVDLMGVSRVGQAYGIQLLFMGLSGAFGPPLAGLVYEWTGDFVVAYILHGIFLILSGLVMIPSSYAIFQQKKNVPSD